MNVASKRAGRMSIDFENVIRVVAQWCDVHAIRVKHTCLPAEKAGEFTGRLVVMNRDFNAEERLYYLSHAIGSIVLWSQSKGAVQHMFDELRDAKENREAQRNRLERAIGQYRAFEIASSELGV